MVNASEIIKLGEPTLVIFWKEGDKGIYDQIGSLSDLVEDRTLPKLRIVAVYNATVGTYSHVIAEINGNDLDADIYMDVNGELHQAMGLSQASSFLLFDHNASFVAQYLGACACTASMASPEITAMLAVTDRIIDHNSIPDNY